MTKYRRMKKERSDHPILQLLLAIVRFVGPVNVSGLEVTTVRF